MGWLDTKKSSKEITGSVSNSDSTSVSYTSIVATDFFESDDCLTGVDIDGYLFFPKKVDGSESFSHREFIRTKIMSGGEFVTRGQYIPKEFAFDTIIDIDPENIDNYLNVFGLMENRVCRITSPYMGGMFKGEVMIEVTHPEASPHVIECKVTIKEIPDVMARLDGDPVIQYPSTTTVNDVSVRDRGTTKTEEDNTNNPYPQHYDDYNSSRSPTF